MIDLRKIKQHCDSYNETCKNCEGYCAFFGDGCILEEIPAYLGMETIEKIYNKLFNQKAKCQNCDEDVEMIETIDYICPNCHYEC